MNKLNRARLRQHLLYAIVISGIAVLASYKGVLPVFRSHLKDYLGIGDAGFGLLFSIGTLPGIVTVLFGGQLIDRWGPRRVIRVCLVGIACGMLTIAFGGCRLWPFLLAMVFSGAFSGSLFIAISAYLGKLFPKHQRQVISLNLASTSVGGMMFPLVAEGLLTLSHRYETISFGAVLHLPFLFVGCLLFGLSFLYRRPATGMPPAAQTDSRFSRRRWEWRDMILPRMTFMLAALIALHGTADGVLYIWMARFLESSSFTCQPLKPGLVLAGYSMAYLLARGFLAAMPDRMGRRTFMIVPGILGGCILVAGLFSRSYMLTAGGYVLGALFWSCEYPAIVSTLLRADRRQFGAVMAMSGVMTSILSFLAINAMGMVINLIGEANMWMAMALLPSGFILAGLGGRQWLKMYGGRAI